MECSLSYARGQPPSAQISWPGTYSLGVTTVDRSELTDLVKEIHGRGWAPGTGGNFSKLLNRNPFLLLITPSGVDKGRITEDQLLEVDGLARSLDPISKPSAETLLHVAILGETDAQVVVHTHSVWNTLASNTFDGNPGELIITGYEMLKGLAGVLTHEHRERIPILPNSQDMEGLAEVVKEMLREDPLVHGFLLQGHGLYTWGRDIMEARRHLEVLEFLFEVHMRSEGLTK